MKSIFITLNVKNKNDRIYTKENIEIAVEEFLDRKYICYGELEHTNTFDMSLSRVSHTVDNIWFHGNKLMGEITILNTYYGKKLKDLISYGTVFSVRPRSTGIVDTNGYVHLSEILTFDVVMLENDSFCDIKMLRKIKLEKIAKMEKNNFIND